MSDVERICEVNYQRVRWAEEYAGGGRGDGLPRRFAPRNDRGGREARIATGARRPRNDREGTDYHGCKRSRNDRRRRKDKQRRIFRTASLGCAMFCGMGTAYLGLGVAMWHLPTMVAGIVAAVVFLVAGWRLDEKVEEMTA